MNEKKVLNLGIIGEANVKENKVDELEGFSEDLLAPFLKGIKVKKASDINNAFKPFKVSASIEVQIIDCSLKRGLVEIDKGENRGSLRPYHQLYITCLDKDFNKIYLNDRTLANYEYYKNGAKLILDVTIPVGEIHRNIYIDKINFDIQEKEEL